MGNLKAFSNALAVHQANEVENGVLREIKHEIVSLSPPEIDDQVRAPSFHGWLLKYDTNKYLHILLLHDRLDWLEDQGLSSFLEYPELTRDWLEKYLSKAALDCQMSPEYCEGVTLLILGGLGRGFMLPFYDRPPNWRLSVIRISDLILLAGEIHHPFKLYLKCIKQKEWAESQGVYFQNLNGDFNFYCYWRRLNHQLVPRDLPVSGGSMISIGNDFVLHLREELRNLVDGHVVSTASGQFAPVERFGRDYYFKSMQKRPIYASLTHLSEGILAGVVETSRGPSWLIIEPQRADERVQRLLYEVWSGFIGLYDRLVTETEAIFSDLSPRPLETRLDLQDVEIPEEYMPTPAGPINEPVLVINHSQYTSVIKLPPDFLIHFQKPENTGETLLLRVIAQGLASLHSGSKLSADDAVIETLLGKVIRDKGTRVLHLYATHVPLKYLLSRQVQKPTFLAHEDFVFAKLKLSEGLVPITADALTTKAECNKFLHSVVDKVWSQLREVLIGLDRSSVIRRAIEVHEAVIRDRNHWHRTAQAVISIYSPAQDVFSVAQQREQDRNYVALSARTIMEMAICECPASGGRQLSKWDLDELLAKLALLVEAATDSDAINGDLIEPIVHLHANGEYTMDRGFHKTVIQPFFANYHREDFEEAASDYSRLYEPRVPNKRARLEEHYRADFIEAFTVEFGLTPDEAVDGVAELFDYAVELDSVLVETTLGVLRERLTKRRGMSSNKCQAFFNTFCLLHRTAWEQPPKGFKNRDLNPWRFSRRLSATLRPLLAFGENDSDEVLYGAGSLRQGFGLLIGRAEEGQFPTDFFTSKEMKKYIGSVNDQRGHAFAEAVADELRKNGWAARNEVQMTSLGAKKELGDLDVLSWSPAGQVLLIECKRLQLARTVAEIAEICRRFRGEAKDELGRHVRRVEWVRQNTESLTSIAGFLPKPQASYRLVTNTHVPMM